MSFFYEHPVIIFCDKQTDGPTSGLLESPNLLDRETENESILNINIHDSGVLILLFFNVEFSIKIKGRVQNKKNLKFPRFCLDHPTTLVVARNLKNKNFMLLKVFLSNFKTFFLTSYHIVSFD